MCARPPARARTRRTASLASCTRCRGALAWLWRLVIAPRAREPEHHGQRRHEQRRGGQLLAVRHRTSRRSGQPAAATDHGHAGHAIRAHPEPARGGVEGGLHAAVAGPRVPGTTVAARRSAPTNSRPPAARCSAGRCSTCRSRGRRSPTGCLRSINQSEVGVEGYDAGAAQLRDFFHRELRPLAEHADLDRLGRRIIEACLGDATLSEYEALMPRG